MQIAEEFIKSKPQSATKVIVSSHNFETTPSLEELEALVKSIKDTGADIVKVVTTAKDITDCKHVFDLLKKSDVRHFLSTRNFNSSHTDGCISRFPLSLSPSAFEGK